MATAIAANDSGGEKSDQLVRLVPGGAPSLAQLSDDELLANTRRLVGKSNQLLAALLLHLAEVETRGIHRIRSCASLYTYCIYELRFSEDAAARRSAAARFVKQFPALLDAVADGELHLTGLLMIGPHLTPENQLEVLGRAKFRTKKELAKLVRDLNPLPSLRDCVEPLGPNPVVNRRHATWSIGWHYPPVRELPAGERPRDWVAEGESGGEGLSESGPNEDERLRRGQGGEPRTERSALPVGPIPQDLPPVTAPQHYGVQFSTVEEHVRLIEKARALLARERAGITLGELHFEAMKVLVALLEKRRFAVGAKPRPARSDVPPRHRGVVPTESRDACEPPRQRGAGTCEGSQSRQRSRRVPAGVRREVYGRDGGRCTYTDTRGERCNETHFLELHHLDAFAKGGGHLASNLALRCAAHNALAAEEDFGEACMARHRDSSRHEPLAPQLGRRRTR